MADAIPVNFPIHGESAIASYPYEDIKSGTGSVLYYLYKEEDSSGVTFAMDSKIVRSKYRSGGSENGYAENSSTIATETFTFYTKAFNAPKNLKGDIYFDGHHNLFKDTSSSGTSIFQMKFYHYDGSTSTQMGSTWVSATISHPGSGASLWQNIVSVVNVSTNYHFKIGDKIKVELILINAGTGAQRSQIPLSPMNYDVGDVSPTGNVKLSTQFKIWIPYKLGL